MKKILFLVAIFSFASMVSLSAQTKTAVKQDLNAAIEAAKKDPSIIQKEGKDGLVSFSKKSVCSKSGKVSYNDVQFDSVTNSWVEAKSCSKTDKKAKSCCSDKKAKSCTDKKAKSCSEAEKKGKKAKSCSGHK